MVKKLVTKLGPDLEINIGRPLMDSACHLSVIVDLSPSQWSQSSEPRDDQSPFGLADFLPQLLVFFNAHIAAQHENSLTVFGALPGKRLTVIDECTTALSSHYVHC